MDAANSTENGVAREKSVFIDGSMGRLYALCQLPDLPAGGACPMVILCHGFSGTLDFHLWPPLVERLAARGIGTLRFDFNGHGKSDGKFEDMTVPNEIDDLMSVIAWVQALPTTESVSLVGHSQGGVVVGMAAGQCGASQIESLVLLSAAAVLRDDALRGETRGLHCDPWHLNQPSYKLEEGLNIGRSYIQTAMHLPIYQTTARYTGPTFIVHGMADRIVPLTYAQRYKQALPQSKLVLVPGADHVWSKDPGMAVDLLYDWLAERLAQRPAS